MASKTVTSAADESVAVPGTAPPSAPTPDVVRPRPPRVQARSDDIKLGDHGANTWRVTAQVDHTIEQAQDLRYCWHKHAEIKPGDTVIITHKLWFYIVEILVKEVDMEAKAILGWYRVRDLTQEELHTPDLADAELTWLGNTLLWGVVHDGQVLASGFETQREAEAYLFKKQVRRQAVKGVRF